MSTPTGLASELYTDIMHRVYMHYGGWGCGHGPLCSICVQCMEGEPSGPISVSMQAYLPIVTIRTVIDDHI